MKVYIINECYWFLEGFMVVVIFFILLIFFGSKKKNKEKYFILKGNIYRWMDSL